MAYPFTKYNYKVEIDGITEASFSEVSGFDASIDVIEYRTGDEGVNWSRKMNGLTKFGNVTPVSYTHLFAEEKLSNRMEEKAEWEI